MSDMWITIFPICQLINRTPVDQIELDFVEIAWNHDAAISPKYKTERKLNYNFVNHFV